MTAERPDSTAREAAREIVRRLAGAGYVAYFAGGCVRDRLLGLDPTDYDVATEARPDDVLRLFPRGRRVGEAFGVILVRSRGHTVEVATFRTDGAYSDGRHPDEVLFSDAEHDARRRDFTINGLFEDPIAERIIDHVGGRNDIAARLVRAIGDPAARLREDQLRTLRAVRFAARFGFAIEAATAEAIAAGAGSLDGISRERIGHEVRRMLGHSSRAVAAWELQYLGLDAAVLGEPRSTTAPRRLGRLAGKVSVPTALAAWMLDRYDDREVDLRPVAKRWSAALMLSNAERRALYETLGAYCTLVGPWPRLRVATQKRLASRPEFPEALRIVQAADTALFVAIRRRADELAGTGLAPPPLLDGDALIAAGYDPGPEFKTVLEAVYDAQLEGGIRTPQEALALARELMG